MYDIATYLTSDSYGTLMVNFVQAPNYELQTVSGTSRLVQNITRWIITPKGYLVFSPDFGNPMLNALGQATADIAGDYMVWLKACEYEYLIFQQNQIALNQISSDEIIDHFEQETIGLVNAFTVSIDFTVVAQSTQRAKPITPILLRLAA